MNNQFLDDYAVDLQTTSEPSAAVLNSLINLEKLRLENKLVAKIEELEERVSLLEKAQQLPSISGVLNL